MTYKLQIRQTNIYDSADGFQLLLHMNEPNQTMYLWQDTSVAACKTKATAIFKNGGGAISWTAGDVSTSGSPNGSDLVWADAALTL
jgi:hypothetical protein